MSHEIGLSQAEKQEEAPVDFQPILTALENYDLESLTQEIEKSRMAVGLESFVLGVTLPLLGTIGRLVCAEKLTITQEHIISGILRDQLNQLQVPQSVLNSLPHRIALATPEGDHHEFGILLANLLCKNRGFRSIYLGPDMPVDALADVAKHLKPKVILLGTSALPLNSTMDLTTYVASLRKKIDPEVQLWVGGPMSHQIDLSAKPIKTFDDFLEELEKIKKEVPDGGSWN